MSPSHYVIFRCVHWDDWHDPGNFVRSTSGACQTDKMSGCEIRSVCFLSLSARAEEMSDAGV